jgi:hypothetical protein
VPALVISPWVDTSAGHVNTAVYSFDQFATLAENWFAGGYEPRFVQLRQRRGQGLSSVSYCSGGVGCPGGSARVGDLRALFNFTQVPLPVDVLSAHIPTGIEANCSQSTTAPYHCTSATVTVTWNKIAQNNVPGPFTDVVVRDGAVIGSVRESVTRCPAGVCSVTDTLRRGSGAHFYWLYSLNSLGVRSPDSAQADVDE